jgi:cell division protein FtsQ
MTMTEFGSAEDETVALVTQDFQRRRRAARLRRWRPLLIGVLVVALVSLGVYALYFSSWLTVRDVEVSGNSSLSAGRIESAARAPIDEPLASADLDAIRARVEALPPVKEASVSRSWPHTLHIDVVERTPMAVVNRGSGLQAVDEDGVLFGRYARQPKDLPLVRTDPDVKAEALAEAARVVGSLRADIAAKVRYVDVETVDEIRLLLSDGRSVMWGSAEQSAQKAEVLAVLLDQKQARRFDVSVPGRPTTR